MTHNDNKKPTSLQEDITYYLSLAENFGAFLLRETAALNKMDFQYVGSMQKEKVALAREYNDVVNKLTQRKNEMVSLDDHIRMQIAQARTEFTRILQKNLQALNAARKSAQRLASRILATARNAITADKQIQYSAQGQMLSYSSVTLSHNVDTQL